ncbi:uncharacterized protein FIBRA_04190 [Fibroporia radiculosa]|uniref:Mixed lineage kinase domain-containing protein n=1 Tax=Fibroporia radiculosa TaxID=599839 RepID=J4G6Z5_9APHY|nr:uncharacterized protein FIBRA_04190 [Fibroporia radiculosa]CCM02113.1 predicted protein [Fibroporia radiculosa]
MPLRYVRSKVTAGNVLRIAITTTAAAESLANLASFPPAAVAAAILLKIFQIIQDVQNNRSDCYRLANRCLSLLVDMKDQMEDRWDDAPTSLLKAIGKFEQTLESIYTFLQNEADKKWKTRLLRKGAIEGALTDLNLALDDAARSFQIATLINIHYAVGDRSNKRATSSTVVQEEATTKVDTTKSEVITGDLTVFGEDYEVPPLASDESPDAQSVVRRGSKITDTKSEDRTSFPIRRIDSADPIEEASSSHIEPIFSDVEVLDHRGFRRYQQSEVFMQGRSRIKRGWWAGATEVRVNGQLQFMKRYEGNRGVTVKKWMRDVKILQNLYHPNLPQMVGYSYEECPTPFILLANDTTATSSRSGRNKKLRNGSLRPAYSSFCSIGIQWYTFLDLEEQLNVDPHYIRMQLCISNNADFRIYGEETLVMGLPPPAVDNWQSWRNYGLAHSVRGIYLKLLPTRGFVDELYDPRDSTVSIENQQKHSHLTILLKSLLPSNEEPANAVSRLQALMPDEDEDEESMGRELTLKQFRLAALNTSMHQTTWRQKVVPTYYKYTVGDVGYVPEGGDFASFVVLCNVIRDEAATVDVSERAVGEQWQWSFGSGRQELPSFMRPDGKYSWTVMLPAGSRQQVTILHEKFAPTPGQAWKFLLENGRRLGQQHSVQPQDLMLVTRVGVQLDFGLHCMGHPGGFHHAHHQGVFGHSPFGNSHSAGGFSRPGQSHFSPFSSQPPMPTILYLTTAFEEAYQPEWVNPVTTGPRVNFHVSQQSCGYLNYVRLHAEDFA